MHGIYEALRALADAKAAKNEFAPTAQAKAQGDAGDFPGKEHCLEDDDADGSGFESAGRKISYLIIHRIKVSQAGFEDSPEGISDFFSSHPEGIDATGGAFPYHFLVEADGEIVQMEATDMVTPHAARYNRESIGIAMIGDFRNERPSWRQMHATFQLCCDLLERFPEAHIVGHGKLPGASQHQGKSCPGDNIDVDELRKAAVAYSKIVT